MNLADTRFIVVEDQEPQREEVLNALLKCGLNYGNCHGEPATFAGARDLIDQHAKELDLVLLDLNLPRDDGSDDLDKDFGYQLLSWIHNDLNSKVDVHIRVIVISGEYDGYGVRDRDFRKQYEGTLVDIAPKKDLPVAVARSLAVLSKDPLLERIRALQIPIDNEYSIVTNHQQLASARLEAAKDIACRLLMNEGDFRSQSLGSTSRYQDQLNNALKDLVEGRFKDDARTGKRYPTMRNICHGDDWGRFLWRGVMYQHLYAINNYYNHYKHIDQQPYSSPPGTHDEWTIPKADLDYFNDGQDAVQIVQIIVKDLLRWYLPWHEQVYQPWYRKASVMGGPHR